MRIKYVGQEVREIPALGIVVKTGDTFECPDDIGANLVTQEPFNKAKADKAGGEQ